MIRGKKVVLREKRLEDARQDYVWKTDPELSRLDATLPLTLPFREYLLTYAEELDRRMDGKGCVFAIETLDGKHIGNCCYYNMERDKKEAEIGIMIGDPSYWDAGYGTDAVKTLVSHVFRKEGVRKLYLHTLVWNTRARKCFEKCGFVESKRVTRSGYDFILMEMKRPAKLPADDVTGQADQAP
ncbi:MAG: GNAT family N-acetyltransferase [Dehalococcoidia bacterium]|nr:GNAT family N-acetyltransferase [Dehalococcoidia bacterium]